MELRHFRHFVAVAEERNLTRAAKKLFISQPPLSRSIQQLEEELGVTLFVRHARGLELTPAAHYFLPHVQQLLQRLDTLVAETQRMNEKRTTLFSIGFEPSIFYGQLPLMVRRLRRNKHLEIMLHEMPTGRQTQALKTGKIDIGFGRVRVQDPAIEQKTLFNEPMLAALPSSHPLCEGPVSLEQVSQLNAIIFPPGPGPSFATLINGYFHQRQLKINVVQEVNDLQTALSLVASEMGFTLVPEQVAQVQRDGVRYVPLTDSTLVTTVICSRRANEPSNAIMRLADIILAELVDNRLSGRYRPGNLS